MATTLFRSPRLQRLLAGLSRGLLRVSGWRIVGVLPPLQRYVLIGAPHTSNWDFPLMLMAVLTVNLDVHWMGKHTLFQWPFGALMRWLGGIPIDRAKANDTVAQMVDQYSRGDPLVILVPPEGTRAKVKRWKTGFYHIASGAGVPIVLGFIDARSKTIGYGPLFYPTGNLDDDLIEIQRFYADKAGLRSY